jgi:hypothetical protein
MPIVPQSLSLRRRLASAAVAMVIFACLGAVTTAAVGRPVEIGTTNAVLIGSFFTAFSIVGVLMMRVIRFIGLDTLSHLTVGIF